MKLISMRSGEETEAEITKMEEEEYERIALRAGLPLTGEKKKGTWFTRSGSSGERRFSA